MSFKMTKLNGLEVLVKPRTIGATRCMFWLAGDQKRSSEMRLRGAQKRDTWRINDNEGDQWFEIQGKLKRGSDSEVEVFDSTGFLLASVALQAEEDPPGGYHERIRLNAMPKSMELTSSRGLDTNEIVRDLILEEKTVGQFRFRNLGESSISLDDPVDVDLRALASLCLIAHMYFAGAGNATTFLGEILSYFR